MTIQVGLFLSNQQPPGRNLVRALDEQLVLVHEARDDGWDSVFTGHHYLTDVTCKLQPVPLLARLAPEAGDMRMGLAVLLLALRNPVHVAETMAALDVVCGGRLVLGVGLGYREVEARAFGIPSTRGMVERFEANLEVLRNLWSGRPTHVDLPWCRLDGAVLTTQPHQHPHPPIWIGANSDIAVRRAAQLEDAWIVNPHAHLDVVARQLELFRSSKPNDAADPNE